MTIWPAFGNVLPSPGLVVLTVTPISGAAGVRAATAGEAAGETSRMGDATSALAATRMESIEVTKRCESSEGANNQQTRNAT